MVVVLVTGRVSGCVGVWDSGNVGAGGVIVVFNRGFR